MPVTVNDIAKRTGLGQATVSRILNRQDLPSFRSARERAERVRRVAAEMGYRANTAAQATASGRFNCVSLVLSNQAYRSATPGRLLQAIGEALTERGIRLDVATLSDESLTSVDYMPRVLAARCSDGLLVNYHAAIPPRMIDLLESAHIPVVWINARRESDAVYPDDYLAGREAADRLISAGHRRIAYVDLFWHESADAGVRHYSKKDRRDGVRGAVEAAGGDFVMAADSARGERYDHFDPVRELFNRPDRPTGLVCYSEIEARVVEQVASEIGLRVPDHLSLIDFGDYNDFADPRLRRDSMVVQQGDVGSAAVSMLLQKIERPNTILPGTGIPLKYEVGGSLRMLKSDP